MHRQTHTVVLKLVNATVTFEEFQCCYHPYSFCVCVLCNVYLSGINTLNTRDDGHTHAPAYIHTQG